ncbi:MAG TPA: Rnase Y domain-containing protein [Rhodopila sp.]|jgi:flagellar motility protein MotE (MotC chaperone)|nr:Rnase Y domain-containing protein [Rhodopila sp.]
MANLRAPRLLPMTMAMIVVVIVAKAGILMNAVITDGSTTPLLAPAHAAAADHFQEPPKPVPAAPKPAQPTASPSAPTAAAKPGSEAKARDAPMSDSEKALLQQLRERRRELDARASAINQREAVLGAAEQKLDTKVGELKTLQKKLETLDTAQKQKEDAGWQSMVKLYEAMKPRDAAAIFNDLSMQVLLQVMDRMKDAKAAAVLAAMSPDKARDVTAALAQMRTGRDAAAAEGARSAGS